MSSKSFILDLDTFILCKDILHSFSCPGSTWRWWRWTRRAAAPRWRWRPARWRRPPDCRCCLRSKVRTDTMDYSPDTRGLAGYWVGPGGVGLGVLWWLMFVAAMSFFNTVRGVFIVPFWNSANCPSPRTARSKDLKKYIFLICPKSFFQQSHSTAIGLTIPKRYYNT